MQTPFRRGSSSSADCSPNLRSRELNTKLDNNSLRRREKSNIGSEMVVAGGLGNPPDRSMVEESRQALSRIDSDLARKLKAISALSAPVDMEDTKWQASRAAMEFQAKNDAEKEKLPHNAVIQLYELHQIYDGLVSGAKNVPQTSKCDIMLTEEKKLPAQDGEKKIAAAIHQEKSLRMASTVLDLSGLLFDRVPDSLQKLSSTLVKLDLSNNNLETLPEAVTSLVNLISLDIHSNQISSLPDSVGRLANLKVFNVSGNLLAALPDSIEGCCAVEELIADFNQLRCLPEGLGFELVNLRKLSVNSNRLTSLPYSTSHMIRLRVLDVHLNHLGSLPADLENLTNLETLNLSKNFNYFVSLPETIGGLTALVELDVSYNHIKALPNSIGRLEKLQRLNVEGNPLVIPPPHIVEHSVAAVQEYLRERLKMCGKKGKGHSWLRQLVPSKWGRPNAMKYNSRVLSLQEDCVSSPRASANFLPSTLRFFTPGSSSSPFRAFATPLRPRRNSYAAI